MKAVFLTGPERLLTAFALRGAAVRINRLDRPDALRDARTLCKLADRFDPGGHQTTMCSNFGLSPGEAARLCCEPPKLRVVEGGVSEPVAAFVRTADIASLAHAIETGDL